MKTAVILSALMLFITPFSAGAAPIDFTLLHSPIVFQGDHKFAYRDPAVVYFEGVFHLYFTLSENAADGGYYNCLAMSTSTDLVHWSFPQVLTPHDRQLNYSSPGNVLRFAGAWVLCLQTYPTPEKQTYGSGDARIFLMRSDNLFQWSAPELLRVKGDDVAREDMGRMIDPYLVEDAKDPGKWWCFYKQNGVSMSWSRDLEHWTYSGRADAGENVTVLREEDAYLMFHSPKDGIGIKRSTRLDQWGEDIDHLRLGQSEWPWAQRRLTAATVVDLRKEPNVGKCLMFFHGEPVQTRRDQPAHGEASLAIAWSDDLRTWSWPKD